MSRHKGGTPSLVVEIGVGAIVAVMVTIALHYIADLNWTWSIIGGVIAGFGGWLAWLMYCHATTSHDHGERGGTLTALVDDLF